MPARRSYRFSGEECRRIRESQDGLRELREKKYEEREKAMNTTKFEISGALTPRADETGPDNTVAVRDESGYTHYIYTGSSCVKTLRPDIELGQRWSSGVGPHTWLVFRRAGEYKLVQEDGAGGLDAIVTADVFFSKYKRARLA